jgi:phosphoglycerate dehydrogenase-like enzyme
MDDKGWIVGITDHIAPPADIEQSAFPEARFRFLPDWRAAQENREEWRQVDAVLVWHWIVDRATLGVLDRCQIIVRYGVGYDLVDVGAIAERGILFCNTPDYGTEEVADTACAMILALQRKIMAYDRDCRRYTEGWQKHLLHPTWRTSERTLGLIGVGRIGTAVVNRMKPFGYRTVGYDPYQPSGHEKAVGYQRVDSLAELLSEADIVSVHCPLTQETRGMHVPVHADHRFRWMPSTRSGPCRPPVPTACRPLFRAYRNRWTASFGFSGRHDSESWIAQLIK